MLLSTPTGQVTSIKHVPTFFAIMDDVGGPYSGGNRDSINSSQSSSTIELERLNFSLGRWISSLGRMGVGWNVIVSLKMSLSMSY